MRTAEDEIKRLKSAIGKLQRDRRALRKALELIRYDGCESFTTGLGSCFRHGRTPDSQDGADRCCPSCVANAALLK